jgi:hypothetical protein
MNPVYVASFLDWKTRPVDNLHTVSRQKKSPSLLCGEGRDGGDER